MAEDAREDWLLQQVAMAFKAVTAVTPEKFNAFFRAEKTVGALDQFLNGGECNALFFYLDKATLSISMVPPKGGVLMRTCSLLAYPLPFSSLASSRNT